MFFRYLTPPPAFLELLEIGNGGDYVCKRKWSGSDKKIPRNLLFRMSHAASICVQKNSGHAFFGVFDGMCKKAVSTAIKHPDFKKTEIEQVLQPRKKPLAQARPGPARKNVPGRHTS